MASVKLTYIGGGGMFVPSMAAALAEESKQNNYQVTVSLYDISFERADRMRKYFDVEAKSAGADLKAVVDTDIDTALKDADRVIYAVSVREDIVLAHDIQEKYGMGRGEDGPGHIAIPLGLKAAHDELAERIKKNCPDALVLSCVNPTDVLAGYMRKKHGLNYCGVCVEVDGLRDCIAYYMKWKRSDIDMVCVGNNHDGWTLDVRHQGRSVYDEIRKALPEWPKAEQWHPGNRMVLAEAALTGGYIKSSGYHQWPHSLTPNGDEEKIKAMGMAKRKLHNDALDEAIATGVPMRDPEGFLHTELSVFQYPAAGLRYAQIATSIATGKEVVVNLQVPHEGVAKGYCDDAVLELMCVVKGKKVTPRPIDVEIPQWLVAYNQVIALQRVLVVDYMVTEDPALLHRAMCQIPLLSTADKLADFADEMHATFIAK